MALGSRHSGMAKWKTDACMLSACVRINMQRVKVSDKTITRETSHVETIEEVDMVV